MFAISVDVKDARVIPVNPYTCATARLTPTRELRCAKLQLNSRTCYSCPFCFPFYPAENSHSRKETITMASSNGSYLHCHALVFTLIFLPRPKLSDGTAGFVAGSNLTLQNQCIDSTIEIQRREIRRCHEQSLFALPIFPPSTKSEKAQCTRGLRSFVTSFNICLRH